MLPSNIPIGNVMTGFFNTDTKKVSGQKIKENVILAIAFDTWPGNKIIEGKKKIDYCTIEKHFRFQAYQ